MKTLFHRVLFTGVWLPALVFMTCGSAAAQCPVDWIKTDGLPGAGGVPEVVAAISWDPDGAGPEQPRLVAGGLFGILTDRVVNKIATLNPETGQWEDMDGGID